MGSSFLFEANWVDVIVLIFLVRGAYIGLNQGFSVELFKTLGAIATAVLTLLCYGRVGEWLSSHSVLSLQIANFFSFSVLIFVLLFVFTIVRTLLFKVLHLQLFYGLERSGGFILGLIRSTVFVSLFLFVLTLLPFQYLKESVEVKSFFGPGLKEIAPKVVEFIIGFKPEQ